MSKTRESRFGVGHRTTMKVPSGGVKPSTERHLLGWGVPDRRSFRHQVALQGCFSDRKPAGSRAGEKHEEGREGGSNGWMREDVQNDGREGRSERAAWRARRVRQRR
eukprot:2255932-Rhodomonas_salina.1